MDQPVKNMSGISDLTSKKYFILQINIQLHIDRVEFVLMFDINLVRFDCCNIDILVPPKITVAPRSQEVIQNSRIVLSCAATGIPVPTVTWTLNGIPVPGILVLGFL